MATSAGRPRLEEVAATAGVSTATVSLVLRGKPGPSEATRLAVLEAAGRLGYRPDRTASLLARRRSHLIGVLLDVANPFHAELVDELDKAADAQGFDLVLSTVTSRRSEQAAIETLLDFRCEGLALLGPDLSGSALDQLGSRVPTVVVGRAGTASVCGVRAADDAGMEAVVDHLVGLGHQDILYLDGPRGSIGTARRKGYRAAMRRHRLAASTAVLRGGNTERAGTTASHAILARLSRPTAVVAYNDRSALGLRDGLSRRGIRVPEDISVVGYDDSPVARMSTVDLTSVSQDPPALARATMDALGVWLDEGPGSGSDGGSSTRPADVVVPPRLVTRSSTCPA